MRAAGLLIAISIATLSCGREKLLRVEPGGPGLGESGRPAPSDLQRLVDGLKGPAHIELAPGRHEFAPVPFRENACPTCTDPAKPIAGTLGLRVSGRGIRITGARGADVVIVTNAGYGILFDNCENCSLESVTVTGGVRDLDPEVPVAAVIAHGSNVTLNGVRLENNTGVARTMSPSLAGIAGVVARGGSTVLIENSDLVRNSGEGVLVSRGSRVTLRDCVINGADKGRAEPPALGGGAGAGVTVDWDGQALIEGTLIERCWMGVRVLRDGVLEARDNAIEDIDSVALFVDDFGAGSARVVFERNAILGTGACGARLVRASLGSEEQPSGSFRDNAITLTGQNPAYDPPDVYCRQIAIDAAVAADFVIADNAFYRNRIARGGAGEGDLSQEGFSNNTVALRVSLRAKKRLADSRFVQAFR